MGKQFIVRITRSELYLLAEALHTLNLGIKKEYLMRGEIGMGIAFTWRGL
jgi:hypothetical protein